MEHLDTKTRTMIEGVASEFAKQLRPQINVLLERIDKMESRQHKQRGECEQQREYWSPNLRKTDGFNATHRQFYQARKAGGYCCEESKKRPTTLKEWWTGRSYRMDYSVGSNDKITPVLDKRYEPGLSCAWEQKIELAFSRAFAKYKKLPNEAEKKDMELQNLVIEEENEDLRTNPSEEGGNDMIMVSYPTQAATLLPTCPVQVPVVANMMMILPDPTSTVLGPIGTFQHHLMSRRGRVKQLKARRINLQTKGLKRVKLGCWTWIARQINLQTRGLKCDKLGCWTFPDPNSGTKDVVRWRYHDPIT